MIKGIGIDAVELSRITRLIEEKPKFIARILTSEETKLFQSLPFHRQVEFLGGRYACKEAFSKAWGTGIGKVTFQDIEILKMKTVSPLLRVPLMKAMYGSVLLTQMKQLLHKLFWKTRKKEK